MGHTVGERSQKLQVHVVKDFTKPTLNFKSLVALGIIEKGWPNIQQSAQDKDQVSHLTNKGLEGDEVEKTVREYSVGSVRVVGRAEGKTNKALREHKYLSWKEWCSVRMKKAKDQRASKEQELGKLKSAEECYCSKEDNNLKRASFNAGNKRTGHGLWQKRRGCCKPDRSNGAFPRGQCFPVVEWMNMRSG